MSTRLKNRHFYFSFFQFLGNSPCNDLFIHPDISIIRPLSVKLRALALPSGVLTLQQAVRECQFKAAGVKKNKIWMVMQF